MRPSTDLSWPEFAELAGLFFLQAMALGSWFVPLGTVLDAHGLQAIKPMAFATSSVGALVSPLMFGALADRKASPLRVLRGLALATALGLAAVATAIQLGAAAWLVLLLIQLQALCAAPTGSLVTSVVLGRMRNTGRQFGPVRASATLGWMVGCWLVSALRADTSALATYLSAGVWVSVAVFTHWLPNPETPAPQGRLTLRQRLGLDALGLFKNRDHRVVFITTALFSIPLAAFYPYAPTQLRELGLERSTAWMTLGQVTEVVALLSLASALARWRIKWIMSLGLGFGVVRYVLCALDGRGWVLAGLTLHGFAFSLFFVTAQLYVDQRVDPAWRTRSQALFSLMFSGVGSLIGYLGSGWWFHFSQVAGAQHWQLFWSGLAVAVAGVGVYFWLAYKGRGQIPT